MDNWLHISWGAYKNEDENQDKTTVTPWNWGGQKVTKYCQNKDSKWQ